MPRSRRPMPRRYRLLTGGLRDFVLAVLFVVLVALLCVGIARAADPEPTPEQIERSYHELRNGVRQLIPSGDGKTYQLPVILGADPQGYRRQLYGEAEIEARFLLGMRATVVAPDLSPWLTRAATLEAANAAKWDALADAYDDAVRQPITGYTDLFEITGDQRYADRALALARRVNLAYPKFVRNLTHDVRMYQDFRRLARLTGAADIHAQVSLLLDRHRSKQAWTLTQHLLPFDPTVPQGAWSGSVTALALMARGDDDAWADAMVDAFVLDSADAVWGAGWEADDGQYPNARNASKAAREVHWVLTEPRFPASTRAAMVTAFHRMWKGGTSFAQFVDGFSQPDFRGGTKLYEGWAHLGGDATTASIAVLDLIESGASGTVVDVNRSTDGSRQMGLVCGIAWAVAHGYRP